MYLVMQRINAVHGMFRMACGGSKCVEISE